MLRTSREEFLKSLLLLSKEDRQKAFLMMTEYPELIDKAAENYAAKKAAYLKGDTLGVSNIIKEEIWGAESVIGQVLKEEGSEVPAEIDRIRAQIEKMER